MMIHSFGCCHFQLQRVKMLKLSSSAEFTPTTKLAGTDYGTPRTTRHHLLLRTQSAPTWALDTEPKGLGGLMTGWVYIMVGGFIIPIEPICGGCRGLQVKQFSTLLKTLNMSDAVLGNPFICLASLWSLGIPLFKYEAPVLSDVCPDKKKSSF